MKLSSHMLIRECIEKKRLLCSIIHLHYSYNEGSNSAFYYVNLNTPMLMTNKEMELKVNTEIPFGSGEYINNVLFTSE